MQDVKQTIRENVLALIEADGGPLPYGQSGVSRLTAKGVALGTAQRILGGQTSVGVDVLQKVAEAFGIKAWHLLVEGLNAKSPPGLTEDPAAWPFPMVSRDDYWSLTEVDRAFVQGALKGEIASRLSAASGKRRAVA
jgi:hypothetical protein